MVSLFISCAVFDRKPLRAARGSRVVCIAAACLIAKGTQCCLSLSLFVIKRCKTAPLASLLVSAPWPSECRPALIAAPVTTSANAAPCCAAQRNSAHHPAGQHPAARSTTAGAQAITMAFCRLRIAATKTAREVSACSL